MPNYKGERRPLADIQPGTPVEIADPTVFYPGANLGVNPLGIFMGMAGGAGDSHPQIQLWDPSGKTFKMVQLYSAKFQPSRYTGQSVDSKCDALKVLTGLKSKSLREAMIKAAPQDYPVLSITNGSDPEVFLVHGDGSVFPAFEFLPGKPKPLKIKMPSEFYTTKDESAYWDGFQAEFTTIPNTCVSRQVDSIHYALGAVLQAAQKVDPTARLSIQSTIPVPEGILATAEPQHVAFGCLPSLNAYGATAHRIDDPRQLPFRFAGGHIHLGHPQLKGTASEVVKTIDAIVGVASVGMFASYDSPVRRRFYGLAGEYRLPTHGLEYRVISNAWLSHPAITMWFFDMVREAAFLGHNGMRSLIFQGYDEARIQGIINESDVPEARKWVTENLDLYNRLAARRWAKSDAWGNAGAPDTAPVISQMLIHQGIESVIKDPTDLAENWSLTPTATTPWVNHTEGRGKNMRRLCHELDAVGGVAKGLHRAVGV